MLEDVQDGEFEFICLIGGNELSEIEIPFSESYLKIHLSPER